MLKIITNKKLNTEEIKPVLHFFNIIAIILFAPQALLTAIITTVYTLVMAYVYMFIKEKTPTSAIIVIIITLYLLTGYVEGV